MNKKNRAISKGTNVAFERSEKKSTTFRKLSKYIIDDNSFRNVKVELNLLFMQKFPVLYSL